MSSRRRLDGRVVAITGGARGIGRATAAHLLGKGARVAIGDVDLETAEATAAELGRGCAAYRLDVTDRDSFADFLDAVERDIGQLDVLVNNAGIMPLGRFLDEDEALARRQVEINLHGVALGMRLALPRLIGRRDGHVVNIASGAGKAGCPGAATYSATKFAVVGLSEAVRGELRGTGVELSVVMPAVVDTELASGLREGRGLKTLAPDEVAEAIADALERPRFDVFVPRRLGPITALIAVVPRAARDRIEALLGANSVLLEFDRSARTEYERRAARDGVPL
jgi:NADP-dependent 3-hydroxy acid dehydrogenase YdfG